MMRFRSKHIYICSMFKIIYCQKILKLNIDLIFLHTIMFFGNSILTHSSRIGSVSNIGIKEAGGDGS